MSKMKTLEFGRYVRLLVFYLCCWLYVSIFVVRFYLAHGILVLRAHVEAADIIAKQIQFGDSLGA
jgi:hypothetical protein